MSSDQVGRAALYDHDDFECVAAGSKKGQFDVQADDVRKVSVWISFKFVWVAQPFDEGVE